jgi:serine/threonine protein kinase
MKANKLIHADIKPDNILLSKGKIKIKPNQNLYIKKKKRKRI